ncbi:MAG: aspartate aminotransferase [Rhodospirillaceae bacterium]|nr:aspartate aminotransferase [Rhodospirillaceae bacterium]
MSHSTAPMDAIRGPVRRVIHDLQPSKIREVAHAGMGDPDVIPLWFGEPDQPTPAFINEAATRAMAEGHTFYTPNRGVPALIQAIARYMTGLYDRPIDEDRIIVTSAGMNGIMMVSEAIVDPGDNVVVLGPIWPNVFRTVEIMGGETRLVILDLEDGRWSLDLDRLFDACDDRTRALYINTPNNPTGWMMSAEEQRAVLEFARKRGIWVVADEVYARMVYDRPHAPSFIEIADPEDLVIVVNSFSKSWLMTGWRLGWLTGPASVMDVFEKLNEYNVAAPASMVQYGGIAAITEGEPLVAATVERYGRARDVVIQRLGAMRRVHLPRPEAAFYAFFSVEGMTDSLAFAKKALAETKVGMAPGIAFGPAGEGFLRICYAKSPESLSKAFDRLEPLLD